VFDDIATHEVERIICLGDIVGYGPDPELCVDLIMEKAEFSLMGNHDYALMNDPIGFNPLAAEAIRITRDRMYPAGSDCDVDDDSKTEFLQCNVNGARPCLILKHDSPSRWRYIEDLRMKQVNGTVLLVHASPLDPVFEYVLPDKFATGWRPERIEKMFASVERLCFCGHTHHPCTIDSDLRCFYPQDSGNLLTLEPDKKYLINTGSVGQPRDGDNRACYLLYDDKRDAVEWRRVTYDIESVVAKSEAMCGKDTWCGVRLRYGK
jgi:diadenosine tetraphosphatase ApaH/serine/threonine PP2A family protein phosphatase